MCVNRKHRCTPTESPAHVDADAATDHRRVGLMVTDVSVQLQLQARVP